MFRVLD